jgi:hypothetical protein
MAVLGQLTDPDHGLSWLRCAAQPNAHCLVGQAIKLLPSEVPLGHWTVPARRIAEVLKTLWDYEPLAEAFWDHTTGKDGGTLTLSQAA